ncbi:TetR/AcrR family transcriptional regulator [Kitasatospora nipponensis]|uniref:TetR/AcrR family transcriptional regulator n=1 Tax=Kitasatospora nipponensis TaxID=258049 RepID=A0ABN1W1X4_9ACTN
MVAETARPSRREQRREQTLQEIKALAMEQIAGGGPDAVSLNGIARSMAMSPAAVYRYFDNRDALLADLVVEVYDSLADALEAAARGAGTPEQRLAAVAHASRSWALEHPNPYRLIFQTTSGSGQDLAPERTIPAASRSMGALLDALSAVAAAAQGEGDGEGGEGDRDPQGPELGEQVRAWAERTGMPDLPVRVLTLGLLCWTRLHGVISLELGHHLVSTGIDPGLLYRAEVDELVRRARLGGRR